jgi:hypothetical protein
LVKTHSLHGLFGIEVKDGVTRGEEAGGEGAGGAFLEIEAEIGGKRVRLPAARFELGGDD